MHATGAIPQIPTTFVPNPVSTTDWRSTMNYNERNASQLLKFYGYHIISREKYVKGEKFLIYSIISQHKYEYKPVVINFD